MKKIIPIILGVVILGAAGALWFFYAGKNKPAPEAVTQKETETKKPNPAEETQVPIRVSNLSPGAQISSPLKLSGEARGTWFFEASFPIRLLDENGKELARAVATAQGEWMTEDFVPFSASLIFDPKGAQTGKIVFEKDNPSGQPELDASYEIPVKFYAGEMMTLKVFFGNKENSSEMGCSVSNPRERRIAKTQAVARAAIEQLLLGPTLEEKQQGYFSSINPGVKLNSIRIQSGTAYVDFSKELEEGVGGSCRVAAIQSEIEETLRQFPTVKKVVISVDGRTEGVLQP